MILCFCKQCSLNDKNSMMLTPNEIILIDKKKTNKNVLKFALMQDLMQINIYINF